MPNIYDAFPSKHLKASDLQGRAITVTIEKVGFEAVGVEREMKAILYFTGKTKGVVLNKTNAKVITKIAGSAITEDWAGLAIAIYPTETEFQGETVDCIRVKPVPGRVFVRADIPATLPAPAPVVQIPDDEIPF